MGGVIIGHEIGRLLNKETIFSERVNGEFKLRRDFIIRKNDLMLKAGMKYYFTIIWLE